MSESNTMDTIKQEAENSAEEISAVTADAAEAADTLNTDAEAVTAPSDCTEETATDEADTGNTEPGENEETETVALTESRGSVAMSILAGLVGSFIGLILCTLAGGSSTNAGIVLFIAIPLCIGLLNRLFRGTVRWPWLVVTLVFSALALYLQPAFSQAAVLASEKGISRLSVPLLAMTQVGKYNFLTQFSPTLMGIFPILFLLVGIFTAWAFLSPKKIPATVIASTGTTPEAVTDAAGEVSEEMTENLEAAEASAAEAEEAAEAAAVESEEIGPKE